MCDENKARNEKPFDTRPPDVIKRQNQLSQFLREINSGKKPSEDSMAWWMSQY